MTPTHRATPKAGVDLLIVEVPEGTYNHAIISGLLWYSRYESENITHISLPPGEYEIVGRWPSIDYVGLANILRFRALKGWGGGYVDYEVQQAAADDTDFILHGDPRSSFASLLRSLSIDETKSYVILKLVKCTD